MSSTEEDSEMSYDSSCSGDSFIDVIEEENGVSRMVIMGLTGLRDSLLRPGIATSRSAVSKCCGILCNGEARPP